MHLKALIKEVNKYWKQTEFQFTEKDKGETYIESLGDYYSQVEDIIFENDCSWWESAMLLTLYQVYTTWAIMKLTLGYKSFNIQEIPDSLIEFKFLENLKDHPEYLEKYKIFNPPLS